MKSALRELLDKIKLAGSEDEVRRLSQQLLDLLFIQQKIETELGKDLVDPVRES